MMPTSELNKALVTLLEHAKHAEIDDDFLAQVASNTQPAFKPQINEICEHFDNFDFNAAQEAIEKLQREITASEEKS